MTTILTLSTFAWVIAFVVLISCTHPNNQQKLSTHLKQLSAQILRLRVILYVTMLPLTLWAHSFFLNVIGHQTSWSIAVSSATASLWEAKWLTLTVIGLWLAVDFLALMFLNVAIGDADKKLEDEQLAFTERVQVLAEKYGVNPPCAAYITTRYLPNAFAMALEAKACVIGFSRLYLENLSERQQNAIIGHELGHVYYHDSRKGLYAQALKTASFLLLIWLFFFPENVESATLLWSVKFTALLLAFLLTRLYWRALSAAISRKQEYRADAFACTQTSALHMRGALQTISGSDEERELPWFIRVSSMRRKKGIFTSHPKISDRLRNLMDIGCWQISNDPPADLYEGGSTYEIDPESGDFIEKKS